MTPQLSTNLLDSAMAEATCRTQEVLCALGQDEDRGYQLSLKPLLREGDARFDARPNKVEQAIRVLNLVLHAIDGRAPSAGGPLTFDQLCDLCAFFIQRIKFHDL